jgi:hypothetical protein
MPDRQSPLAEHLPSAAHGVQIPPPQSRSVSFPFFTPSTHVAGWQTVPASLAIPPPSPIGNAEQTPLAQSAALLQVLPGEHIPHPAPPQSMSVSVPFLSPSAHVAAWQTLAVHTLSMQSAPTLHVRLVGHGAQLPPQSLSVSSPFFTPSRHVGVRHSPFMHTPSLQSVALPHF